MRHDVPKSLLKCHDEIIDAMAYDSFTPSANLHDKLDWKRAENTSGIDRCTTAVAR